MTNPAAAHSRRFPVWAVALVVAAALVLAAVAWALLAALGTSNAERAAIDACRTAISARLGAGTTDVDLMKYQPQVSRVLGSNRAGTFQVAGQVDFRRAGEPDRSYYDCKVRRAGDEATVTSLTGL